MGKLKKGPKKKRGQLTNPQPVRIPKTLAYYNEMGRVVRDSHKETLDYDT